MELLDRSTLPEMQMTALLGALTALKRGDSSVRLPRDWSGLAGKVAETFNDVVELNERTAEELVRLSFAALYGEQGPRALLAALDRAVAAFGAR